MPDKTLSLFFSQSYSPQFEQMGQGGHTVDVGLVLLALSHVQIFVHIVSEQDQKSLYGSIKCSKRKKLCKGQVKICDKVSQQP